jgi:repressor LexA
MEKVTMALTKKQKEVFDFIINFFAVHNRSPSYSEIQNHFGLKSKASIQDYVKYLKNAGLLKNNESGVIELIERPENMIQIPLLGEVAAGAPLDTDSNQDYELISVPQDMIGKGKYFALYVRGNSMIEDCIMDGDVIVVKSQKEARDGQTVVALIEGGATVKKYYYRKNRVELHPRNKELDPIIVEKGNFSLEGIVTGLVRKY